MEKYLWNRKLLRIVFIPGQKTNIKLASWCLKEHIVLFKGSNGLEWNREPQYTKIKGTIIFPSLPTSWQSLLPRVAASEQHNFCISRLFSHQNVYIMQCPYSFLINAFTIPWQILLLVKFFMERFGFMLYNSIFLLKHSFCYNTNIYYKNLRFINNVYIFIKEKHNNNNNINTIFNCI